jgi:hypothetical protein
MKTYMPIMTLGNVDLKDYAKIKWMLGVLELTNHESYIIHGTR